MYGGILFLVACGSERSAPDEILVFADGAAQCEPLISLESSTQALIGAGIDVLWSSCGVKTGIVVATVCGAPSLSILVHAIPTEDLQNAERVGFQPIRVLVDASAGTDYELTDC